MATNERKVVVGAKVDPEVSQRIKALADRLGWTQSKLLAHLIEYGLREGEKFADRAEGPIMGELMRLVFLVDSDSEQEREAFESMYQHIRSRRQKGNHR